MRKRKKKKNLNRRMLSDCGGHKTLLWNSSKFNENLKFHKYKVSGWILQNRCTFLFSAITPHMKEMAPKKEVSKAICFIVSPILATKDTRVQSANGKQNWHSLICNEMQVLAYLKGKKLKEEYRRTGTLLQKIKMPDTKNLRRNDNRDLQMYTN